MTDNELGAGFVYLQIPEGMTEETCVEQLRLFTPISIDPDYFIDHEERALLIVVDVQNGFCTPSCGPLAPPARDEAIEKMIQRIDTLARQFVGQGFRVAVTRDCHDGPEPPFPDHCRRGSIEAELVPQLKWLNKSAELIIDKGCVNAWIGAEKTIMTMTSVTPLRTISTFYNVLWQYIHEWNIETVILVGICTDICVLQLAQSLLSARNCGLLPSLKNVVVNTTACTTYDLPLAVCRQYGLPPTQAHPRGPAQHIGLYLMQQSGAILAENILM